MRRPGALLAALRSVLPGLCRSLAPRVFGAAGPADLVLLHGKVVTVDP